jgi:threonine dehydrogenase-like Zn-dependent dehydrogenase
MSAEKMRAAVLNEPGNLEIRSVDIPEPGFGEVLVRVRACGVCGTDLEIRDNGWEGAEFPFIMGHEWTGEVAALGPGTTKQFEIGDRVASEPHDGCGICRNCKVGKYTACLNYGDFEMGHKHHGFTVDGGYAQYCTLPERNLHHLPEGLSLQEGTLITTAACSLYAVERANVEAGDFVAVLGPGAIGLLAAQIAKYRGASEVLVTGTREPRLKAARKMGADHTVNVYEEDPVEVAKELTDGIGPDVVIEAAGVHQAQTQAVDMVRRGGKVGLVGNPGEGVAELNTQWIVSGDLDVVGVKAEGMDSSHRVTKLMAKRDLTLAPLLTHEYDLEDLHTAMDTFENREEGAIKVVVNI